VGHQILPVVEPVFDLLARSNEEGRSIFIEYTPHFVAKIID
jgi:hypothetical protein